MATEVGLFRSLLQALRCMPSSQTEATVREPIVEPKDDGDERDKLPRVKQHESPMKHQL